MLYHMIKLDSTMNKDQLLMLTFFLAGFVAVKGIEWESHRLPDSHIPFVFSNKPELARLCQQDDQCPYKTVVGTKACFGYETDCEEANQFFPVNCPKQSPRAKSMKDQIRIFYESGDFGIVRKKISQLKAVCRSSEEDGGHLECEENARYCRGKNIKLDLTKAKGDRSYNMEFITAGQLGANCKPDEHVMKNEWDSAHRHPLQSWIHVVEHMTEYPAHTHTKDKCDIMFDKPVYLVQTDAEVNMYHHFCDFVNLYVTQHLNSTTFDMDVHIIPWSTIGHRYSDPFGAAWKAFSINPVKSVTEYIGKTLCFKEVIFALTPRQRLGLFYNMPLIDGCEGTGLFRAFNEHMIHRLNITQHGPLKKKIRVTVLSRRSKYRNILNEQELVDALNLNPKYEAKLVVYSFAKQGEDSVQNFINQIEETHNSDIFVGMHGAGLTHMLFLPHWAAVMELYNCDDPSCYNTLARLRGVKYFTWTNLDKLHQEDEGHHPTLGAHKKFTNYAFDVDEFLRLIHLAADHVSKHPEFRAAKRDLYKSKDEL